jgi:hypothetical protein
MIFRMQEIRDLASTMRAASKSIRADGNAVCRRAVSTAFFAVALVPLGALAAVSESFDGVTPPALPSGWTASVASGAASTIPFHTRASSYASSQPNAVWVDDVDDDADIRLTSPAFQATSATTTFSFKQSYTLWAPDAGPLANGVFNGAILEVSIDGAPFVDVAAAGTIAYNTSLDPGFDNPLAPAAPLNRAVWGDSSGGFVTASGSVSAAVGNTIQFRWRLGTEGGGRSYDTHSGWWIDDFQCDCAPGTVDEIFTNGFDPSP